MKIKRATAVAFLVALGFTKADEWDDTKLKTKLPQVPEKVPVENVPEKCQAIYDKLVEAAGDVELISDKRAPGKIDVKAMDKSALKTLIEEQELPVKFTKKTNLGELQALVEGALEERVTKMRKASQERSAPKPKKPAAAKDAFGCKLGTISAKVNAVMSDEWKTEEEIKEESGVTQDQARGRLYYGAEKKFFEYRRLIQYRINPKQPAAE